MALVDKLDRSVLLAYGHEILPKKMSGQPLKPMERLADIMVSCARKEDVRGLQSAQELLGRIQAGEVPYNKLGSEIVDLCNRIN